MKNYIVKRTKDGILLNCEALVKGLVVHTVPSGPFEIGDPSGESLALARAIADHYYGASLQDAAAARMATQQAPRILDAFLIHHHLPLGGQLEISSDVLDHFFSLAK
jgi:hypothetical protein